MDIKEAINERHSVRQYKDIPIDPETVAKLRALITECNEESGLKFQLITNDPDCFNVFFAHYGMNFRNAVNYVALVGKKDKPDLEEKCGFFGEKIVLETQMMGLNTCWVAGTYSKKKSKVNIQDDEKLVCIIAIGYGENQGRAHKSKPVEKLCKVDLNTAPDWFKEGVDAALKAPTAINQQKFVITLEGAEAKIISKGGAMTKIDLGIVKYNFAAASGHEVK
ncbi:MAG: nitroreductase family protein [Lachnospiraceae bacterium]|nr:nitroreductase family protein [Lachnospiraceae bacterium]